MHNIRESVARLYRDGSHVANHIPLRRIRTLYSIWPREQFVALQLVSGGLVPETTLQSSKGQVETPSNACMEPCCRRLGLNAVDIQ